MLPCLNELAESRRVRHLLMKGISSLERNPEQSAVGLKSLAQRPSPILVISGFYEVCCKLRLIANPTGFVRPASCPPNEEVPTTQACMTGRGRRAGASGSAHSERSSQALSFPACRFYQNLQNGVRLSIPLNRHPPPSRGGADSVSHSWV